MNFRHIAGSSATHSGLRFTPDGNAFIRCLNNATVIQALANPTQQQILRGHEARVSCIDVRTNLLLSGEEGIDSDVILWDLSDGRILQRFSEHDGGIYEVSFSQDGYFYSTLGQDGMLYIVEIASGDIVGRLNTNFIRCKFGPRIKDPRGFQLAQYYLLAVANDGSLQKVVWVTETGQISHEALVQTGTKRFASDITFLESRNGYFAASCTCGDVLIGDLRKAEIIQVIQVRGQGSKLNVCKCFPTIGQSQQSQAIYQTYNKNQMLDEKIAVGGTGILTILRGTNAGTWETALELRFEEDISSIDVDLKGQVICEATNGLVNILTPQTEYKPVTISQSHTAQITDMRFIGDRILTLCTKNNQLRVVDLTDYMPALNIPTGRRANESYPTAVQINMIQLVTGFSNGDVIIFDVENGNVLLELKGADREKINSISCQGQRIVVAGDSGEVRHWDIKARSILEHIQTHQQPINQVVLQKDLNGQPLTLSCGDDKYIVCQVNGVRLLDFQTNGPVRGFVQFQNLFAAVSGYQVLLLDLKENKVIDVLEMKKKLTCCCGIGDQLLVGDEAGSLHYISLNNYKFSIQHQKINVHGSAVWKVAEQGGVIASADVGGELIIWE